MTIYAVGDLQGCLKPLQCLLERVNFDTTKDQLWAAGDVVNRGPQSLDTLRYVKAMGSAFRMVLGNHDLHLLATAHGVKSPTRKDTFDAIFAAPDRDELLHWLQQQPLLIRDHGYVMVHAGIPPQWTISTAEKMARRVEQALQGSDASAFFANMYGNEPARWQASLSPMAQLRTICNYFTRMRFCDSEGNLELETKGMPSEPPKGYAPWYTHTQRKSADQAIIFGHWAALNGEYCGNNLYPLDTGCVWGQRMRLMNLQDASYTHCDCEAA